MSVCVQLASTSTTATEAVAFYIKLFASEPAKVRPGYANFAIAEPPLKLVPLENPGQGGSLNHLGIESRHRRRRRRAGPAHRAGLASADERDTTAATPAGQVLGRGRAGRRSAGRSTRT